VPTKTPSSRGKKSAAKEGAAPKKGSAKAPKAEAKAEPRSQEDGEDESEDEQPPAPPKKPVAKSRAGGSAEVEPPPVVPARRLTPEAKAKVNEMVKKGTPLGEALKMAASWETFVAPVKDEPAKLVQGKPGGPAEGPRPSFRDRDGDDEPEGSDGDDEEPAAEADE
jgi:hypothetical protein